VNDHVQFKTMPADLGSFGVAVDFLSRRKPFIADQVGPFIRAVRRQILKHEHSSVRKPHQNMLTRQHVNMLACQHVKKKK